ncbi:aminotransferase class III-fold pyridoxal phosphate-dependent enzyme [Ramlibacter sp.]|uniref:aminotransferase class III-fold pyridoxal phosphate-dependent enzyme n=1 Tax=Ramlibacter sp. TaxID=1917967 RepID=UPI00178F20E6|nr:aminotransferase class III-fold pyridoxal phosphate-dependent enzyme [Ramlibacter sp.]MBA2676014.1 aminotransferase class III-fold pyridoxal phosphate-dependent enzyme [Ramlibacter sp.]
MDLQIHAQAGTGLSPGYHKVLVPWAVQGGLNPPVVTHAKGCHFYDAQGKRYLDLTSGYVAVSLGHGHPKVVQAIQAQAERMCWVASGYFNDVRAEYAELLSGVAPWAEGSRVHYACGGAEANDDAVKIARLVTRRPKVLTAYRSYHGGTIGASSMTGVDRWRDPFPALPGMVKFFAPYPYRSPFHAANDTEETERALDHLRRVVSHEGAGNVAAIVLEPVTGSSGLVVYPAGYLEGVRALCDAHRILLVFDEVMTGFGRTGAAFAANRLGVAPDLLSFAKGASSSYTPLGGVLVREGIARHFDTELFDVGHTHAGHVLAVAGGLAALKVYIEEGLFERAREIEGWLRQGLGELQARHRSVGDVRGLGAMFGLELVRDRASREPLVEWHHPGGSAPMKAFYGELLRRGVHAYGRYNVVIVTPPLVITKAELDEGFEALDAALTVMEVAC